jgi:hypothetical protein
VLACSVQWEGLPFYRRGRWPWGGAAVVVVVVAVPRSRRGKAWARTVAGVLAKLTRVIVARQGLGSGGELDGSAQGMAVGRGRGRHA